MEPEHVPLWEEWYRGNQAGAPSIDVTHRLVCANPAFLGHFYTKIEDLEANLRLFNDWSPAQKRLYKIKRNLNRQDLPVRLLILKARHQGISTLSELFAYHRTAYFSHVNAMVAAQEGPGVGLIFRKFRVFHNSVPEPLRQPTNKFTLDEISFGPKDDELSHGSHIFCHTLALGGARKKESGKGRGGTYHFLHGSEVAFWPMAERFMSAVSPAIPRTGAGEMILESTANGTGNYFHALWKKASEGWRLVRQPTGPPAWVCDTPRRASLWVPVFLSWLEEPRYQMAFPGAESERERAYFDKHLDPDERRLREEFGASLEQLQWRRSVLNDEKGGDLKGFLQEYPATPEEAFQSSDRKVFEMVAIQRYRDSIQASPSAPWIGTLDETEAGAPLLTADRYGPLKVFREPQQGRSYVIGADACEGRSSAGDRACAQVLCSASPVVEERWEQVAVYTERVDPDEFAATCLRLAKYYGEAFIVAESNGPGQTTCLRLTRAAYYHRYRRREYDKVTGTWGLKWDWHTNTKTRRVMVGGLRQAIREMSLRLHDADTIAELDDWTYLETDRANRKEGPGSPDGNDDRVVALGLALQGGILDAPVDDEDFGPSPEDQDQALVDEMRPQGMMVQTPGGPRIVTKGWRVWMGEGEGGRGDESDLGGDDY